MKDFQAFLVCDTKCVFEDVFAHFLELSNGRKVAAFSNGDVRIASFAPDFEKNRQNIAESNRGLQICLQHFGVFLSCSVFGMPSFGGVLEGVFGGCFRRIFQVYLCFWSKPKHRVCKR